MKLKKEQQTAIAIAIGLTVLALTKKNYYFFIPVGVAVISIPFSLLNRPLYFLWTFIAKVIGWVLQHIFLSIIFFLFLTPLALLKKIFRKKSPQQKQSNYLTRNHQYEPKDLQNPW
jgi:hypothetical protein